MPKGQIICRARLTVPALFFGLPVGQLGKSIGIYLPVHLTHVCVLLSHDTECSVLGFGGGELLACRDELETLTFQVLLFKVLFWYTLS